MRISHDIRANAAEQEQAVELGMKQKSEEFLAGGAAIYR